jgi:hypothetical protein
MKEHATFVTGAVAAIAAAAVVPAIWQGSGIAWAVTAALLLAVVISIVLYLNGRYKTSATQDERNALPITPSPVTVELISTHDQSIASKNKVRSTINVHNYSPSAQPEKPKHMDSLGN